MCNYNILQSENEKALSSLLFYVSISNMCWAESTRYIVLSLQLCSLDLVIQKWMLPS
jgi:hypothetical protein